MDFIILELCYNGLWYLHKRVKKNSPCHTCYINITEDSLHCVFNVLGGHMIDLVTIFICLYILKGS